jgi:hypothetical protein
MPASPTISNIPFPQSRFLDPVSQGPAREWIQWLQNPYNVTQTVQFIIINGGVISGVEINNSVINNSTIGLTTPAAGKFTDLTALNGIGGGIF